MDREETLNPIQEPRWMSSSELVDYIAELRAELEGAGIEASELIIGEAYQKELLKDVVKDVGEREFELARRLSCIRGLTITIDKKYPHRIVVL